MYVPSALRGGSRLRDLTAGRAALGRIVRRRAIMGQGGSKIPGAKRRPAPGGREAAVKLDEIDEEDLASLSDEEIDDLLLAAEADLAVDGPDERATDADASGEARGGLGDEPGGARGGQGSGPVEATPTRSATPPSANPQPEVSSPGTEEALKKTKSAISRRRRVASLKSASSDVLKQSLAFVAAASAGAARRARARPARAARFVAGGLCGGVAKAAAHAALVASAECFAPTRVALAGARAGAALVAGGAALRSVSALAQRGGFAGKIESSGTLITRLATSKNVGGARRVAARLVDVVSPVPAGVFWDACAPFRRYAAAACTAYLRNALRLRLVARASATVAPIKTRQLSYATRVAPVVGAYVVKRELINLTTKPGSSRRDAAWEKTHAWGAERVKAIVLEYGGFFTKIGQLMGTAQQMMPEAYVEAFSQTMDANPPTPFAAVRAETTRSLESCRNRAEIGGVDFPVLDGAKFRDVFEATFSEFDETPAATASIAQVHFARLRGDGARVAVKVVVADKKKMLSDLACASRTAAAMRRLGLDSGVDFETVFAAYSDVVDEEFDLALEAEKMREFAAVFAESGLDHLVAVPEPHERLSGAGVLVSTRARGKKLLETLNRARETGRAPKCPRAAAVTHAFGGTDPRFGGWDGVFHTMHRAWGAMLLRHGHVHCDPHPGNFILRRDGKLAILDWGQTHSFAPPFRRHLCRLVVHMAGEHHEAIAAEVREHSQVRLEHPTTEALSALCFAYFDTRATPLAECNLMDLQNSPFVKNRITRNTREGFNVIRCVFLFRGMMAACGVEASMVEVWERDARKALAEANEPVPSLLVSRGRRAATRAWLTAQKTFNVGAGARLNALEAFVRSADAPPRTSDANNTRGSGRSRGSSAAIAPGTPRRMRSALW